MVIQTRVTPIMTTWYDEKPHERSTLATQSESIEDALTMINLAEELGRGMAQSIQHLLNESELGQSCINRQRMGHSHGECIVLLSPASPEDVSGGRSGMIRDKRTATEVAVETTTVACTWKAKFPRMIL
jgi:hypothetical protein